MSGLGNAPVGLRSLQVRFCPGSRVKDDLATLGKAESFNSAPSFLALPC